MPTIPCFTLLLDNFDPLDHISDMETKDDDTEVDAVTEVVDVGPEELFKEFTTPSEVNATLLSIPRLIGIAVDKLLWRRKEAKEATRALLSREAKLYHDFRFGKDRRYTKDDAIIMYASDPEWGRLKRVSDLANAKVEYYEGRVRMLKETNWALNTYVKHQKYLAGDFNE